MLELGNTRERVLQPSRRDERRPDVSGVPAGPADEHRWAADLLPGHSLIGVRAAFQGSKTDTKHLGHMYASIYRVHTCNMLIVCKVKNGAATCCASVKIRGCFPRATLSAMQCPHDTLQLSRKHTGV